ncbi:MAG: hypothetical protein JWR59_934 [Brevundimonas sp.]|nr:hypothetical protein [Brevundimonas sp.]
MPATTIALGLACPKANSRSRVRQIASSRLCFTSVSDDYVADGTVGAGSQDHRRLRRQNGPAIQAACAQFVVLCRSSACSEPL